MTKVVVHRLTTAKRALEACRLVEKLFEARNKVLVYFTDEHRAASCNEYLWTFSPGSFVGHSLWDGHSELDDHVVLALRTLERPNGATVLVLVDPLVDLAGASSFEEVYDFIAPGPEDGDKIERWRAAGFEVG